MRGLALVSVALSALMLVSYVIDPRLTPSLAGFGSIPDDHSEGGVGVRSVTAGISSPDSGPAISLEGKENNAEGIVFPSAMSRGANLGGGGPLDWSRGLEVCARCVPLCSDSGGCYTVAPGADCNDGGSPEALCEGTCCPCSGCDAPVPAPTRAPAAAAVPVPAPTPAPQSSADNAAGTESYMGGLLGATGCTATVADGGWGFCGPASCKDTCVSCCHAVCRDPHKQPRAFHDMARANTHTHPHGTSSIFVLL